MAKRPGLYANIHAKRKRIAGGSGEKMRKAGSEALRSRNHLDIQYSLLNASMAPLDHNSQMFALIKK